MGDSLGHAAVARLSGKTDLNQLRAENRRQFEEKYAVPAELKNKPEIYGEFYRKLVLGGADPAKAREALESANVQFALRIGERVASLETSSGKSFEDLPLDLQQQQLDEVLRTRPVDGVFHIEDAPQEQGFIGGGNIVRTLDKTIDAGGAALNDLVNTIGEENLAVAFTAVQTLFTGPARTFLNIAAEQTVDAIVGEQLANLKDRFIDTPVAKFILEKGYGIGEVGPGHPGYDGYLRGIEQEKITASLATALVFETGSGFVASIKSIRRGSILGVDQRGVGSSTFKGKPFTPSIEMLSPHAKKHAISRIIQGKSKPHHDGPNTVALSNVDTAADVKAINKGLGLISDDGARVFVNNREYGFHPETGRLFPIRGEGLLNLNAGEFEAVGVFNKFGNTPKAHEVIKKIPFINVQDAKRAIELLELDKGG